MTFSQILFDRIEDIYARILAHPFVSGLTDGSLAQEAFQFYAVQDALYLREFSRGLSLLAAKAPEEDAAILFNDSAKNAIVVERALHGSFFAQWGLSSEQVLATPMAPNNVLYTSYLLRVAYERPFHEVLGAFLPCYWIYWEVGKALVSQGSPVPVYQQWIQTYASDTFAETVQRVLALMDRVAEGLTEAQRNHVSEHFVMASRFEYMFWDMGYQRQPWDI
ncbi:MAG: TenA family transcriptional regulator [Candidatus Entotheonella factor]|uniref:Aminopyrimidine aminohydrolase n=1 Tax=Entotheonella factor TaxID=1429438 RepID=W4LC76_ENTF1|nr:MAG: TenA family transcriptional regulator [Candidatus Entotheonella factor]